MPFEKIEIINHAELVGMCPKTKCFLETYTSALRAMFLEEYNKFNLKNDCNLKDIFVTLPHLDGIRGEKRNEAKNEEGKIDKIKFFFFSKLRAHDDFVIDFNGRFKINGMKIETNWEVSSFNTPLDFIENKSGLSKSYDELNFVTTEENLSEAVERVRLFVIELLDNELSREIKVAKRLNLSFEPEEEIAEQPKNTMYH